MTNNSNTPIHPTGNNQSGTGLTKREYFAGLAMKGILTASQDGNGFYNPDASDTAKQAIQYADELLKQLEEKP